MAKKKTETKKEVDVCWLSGNFAQRRRIIDLVKANLASKGGYELSIYDGEETLEYVKSQVQQRDCFGGRHLVILKDWPAHKTTKDTMYRHFLKMCESVAPGVVLICDNLQTESKKVLNAIEKIGRLYCYDKTVDTRKAVRWVTKNLAGQEKEISDPDAEAMLASVGELDGAYGYDIDRVHLVIEKLCSYVGKRKKITREDVVAVCTDSPNFIIWSLLDSFDKRDYCESIKLFHQALSNSKTPQECIYSMLSIMIWRYRLLLLTREGVGRKMKQGDIIGEVSKLRKLKRTGMGFTSTAEVNKYKNGNDIPAYSPKMVEGMFRGTYRKPPVTCYERKEPFLIYEAIVDTFERIRTGCGKLEAIVVFDALIMEICGVASSESLSKIRRVSNGKFC